MFEVQKCCNISLEIEAVLRYTGKLLFPELVHFIPTFATPRCSIFLLKIMNCLSAYFQSMVVCKCITDICEEKCL